MYFEYMLFKDRHWIGIEIGNYVSHELIANLSVDEINKIDRKKAAQDWYDNEDYWHKKRIDEILAKYAVSLYPFLSEVAEWIDSRIPQAYKKNYLKDSDHGPAQQSIIVDENGVAEYGLIYHYEKNRFSKNVENSKKPTEKQLNYLLSLACKHNYQIISYDFTRKQASQFIDYFKNYGYDEEPTDFDSYFSKAF